jgi:hypothetical protein
LAGGLFRAILFQGVPMLKTYSVYTQCQHCGVYDRDPAWCDLCGRPKEATARPSGRQSVPDGARQLPSQPKLTALFGR